MLRFLALVSYYVSLILLCKFESRKLHIEWLHNKPVKLSFQAYYFYLMIRAKTQRQKMVTMNEVINNNKLKQTAELPPGRIASTRYSARIVRPENFNR